MIAFDFVLFSWIFWLSWMILGLCYELFAVFSEKRTGAMPLTRVVRDHVMRWSFVLKIGVIVFLTWLLIHFAT